MFQYLMKLHYSQTKLLNIDTLLKVSVPYEITLLSNCLWVTFAVMVVSVPYEITLLSNLAKAVINLTSGFSTL